MAQSAQPTQLVQSALPLLVDLLIPLTLVAQSAPLVLAVPSAHRTQLAQLVPLVSAVSVASVVSLALPVLLHPLVLLVSVPLVASPVSVPLAVSALVASVASDTVASVS